MTSHSPQLPPGLQRLAARLGIDASAWPAQGRLDLRVDGHPRVTLRRAPREGVDLQARLGALPQPPLEREALLDRLMLRVTAHAAERIGVPVLSADGRELVLQARVHDDRPHALEDGFEAFLNDLDYWTAVVRDRR
jgi:hypothetical protein